MKQLFCKLNLNLKLKWFSHKSCNKVWIPHDLRSWSLFFKEKLQILNQNKKKKKVNLLAHTFTKLPLIIFAKVKVFLFPFSYFGREKVWRKFSFSMIILIALPPRHITTCASWSAIYSFVRVLIWFMVIVNTRSLEERKRRKSRKSFLSTMK